MTQYTPKANKPLEKDLVWIAPFQAAQLQRLGSANLSEHFC